MRKRKDEYDDLYLSNDDDDENYIDTNDEYEDMYNKINEIRGTVQRGTCMFCGEENGMKYEGNTCFICSKCHEAVYEDIYYQWLLGYDMEFEE